MEQLMKYDPESIRILSEAIREKVDLPVARPTGWHNPRRREDPNVGGLSDDTNVHHISKPKGFKHLVGNLLGFFKRSGLPGRRR
jgi:hypothetical protein